MTTDIKPLSLVRWAFPKTKKHRERIKEHGELWIAITAPIEMQCFDNRIGVGCESMNTHHYRNIEVDELEVVVDD